MKKISILFIIFINLMISCDQETGDEKFELLKMPESNEGIITFMSGEVYYSRNNEWKDVFTGDKILKDDYIKVLEDSFCEIQFGDKAVIRVQENSVINLRTILHTDSDYNVETELVFGAVLCKLVKLSENDRFNLISDTSVFRVRGTEFMLRKGSEMTTVSVLTGSVSVTSKNNRTAIVSDKEQLVLDNKLGDFGSISPVSGYNQNELEQIKQMKFVGLREEKDTELVKIVVIVEQSNAEIYIENDFVGIGNYYGIFNNGDKINFIIKKRGYKDMAVTITADKDIRVPYIVDMEIGDIQDDEQLLSIDEQKRLELLQMQNRISELNSQYKILQSQLDTEKSLNVDLNTQLQSKSKENEELRGTLEVKESENREIEEKLKEKEEMINSLRELLGP